MTTLPRWALFALLGSMAVNLFLVGMIAGDWARGRRPLAMAFDRPGPRDGGETMVRGVVERMLGAIPAEQRGTVEQRLAGHRPEIQRANRELRVARERAREAFLAEPLDRAGLERAYAEQRQRNGDLQATIHRAVLEAMAGLPVETRRGVVGALGMGGGRR